MEKEKKANIEITARTISDFESVITDLEKLPATIVGSIIKAEINWLSKIIIYTLQCYNNTIIVTNDITKVVINKEEITVSSSENKSLVRVFKTKFVENVEITGINLNK